MGNLIFTFLVALFKDETDSVQGQFALEFHGMFARDRRPLIDSETGVKKSRSL